jgi:hypothetical protein
MYGWAISAAINKQGENIYFESDLNCHVHVLQLQQLKEMSVLQIINPKRISLAI